jgi:aspartate ammonia-lyase
MGDVLAFSGALRRLAVEVSKVASDLRLLSMGPRAGLAEIKLPSVQPGSSIMPGKVNPSVPEMVNQVCYQVYGCDATILAGADAGQLELNVMMPVIAWNALHATRILRQAMRVLQTRTIAGIEADADRCRELLDRSTAVATALSPYIGYAATADVAKTSVRTGRPVHEIVRERKLIPDEALDAILSAAGMTSPGIPGRKEGKRSAQSQRAKSGAAAGPAGGGPRVNRRAPARQPVSSTRAGAPRGTGSGGVAAAGQNHGRARDRRERRRR